MSVRSIQNYYRLKVNVNKRIAIVLDKKVHMAPVIRSQIFGGATVIEGMDSIQEAEDIAIVLRAGALPVPVTIVDQRIVGPSLGADSVSAGTSSIMMGLLLIFPPTRKLLFNFLSKKFPKENKKKDFIEGDFEDIDDNKN